MRPITKIKTKALLIAVKTPKMSEKDVLSSLDELERLVTTLGFEVTGKDFQRQPSTNGSTVVGAGKLKEIAQKVLPPLPHTEQEPATLVVFDCDLKPSQMRHVESALGVEVLDRTGVIIEIFSRHAKTRAAKLQVEIARLNYLSPRIREVGSSGERQQGRGGGESALETGRREIRDRLAELKKDLAKLQSEQAERQKERAKNRSVALVGYTNAGKSSTMRALTGSDVLVEDKLFATLDTTVRALKPETTPRILVSDTVGFIKKLPHDLVASFRSTLDEARLASLLLYIVDASDPDFRAQLETVAEVLKEVGVQDTPVLLVLNKADQLTELEQKRLKREYPDSILSSAFRKEDAAALRDRIRDFFEKEMIEAEIFAPWEISGLVGEIREKTRVIRESNEENGTRYFVRARPGDIIRLKRKFGI